MRVRRSCAGFFFVVGQQADGFLAAEIRFTECIGRKDVGFVA